jgi:hypothetical protein
MQLSCHASEARNPAIRQALGRGEFNNLNADSGF